MPVTAASYWTQGDPYQCHLTMMAALTMAALTIAVAHLVMAHLAHLAQHHHLSSWLLKDGFFMQNMATHRENK